MVKIFYDRKEAGQELARALQAKARKDVIILALPRGGVGVAVEVAKAFKTPLECLFVRKLGSEFNPELGVGAIVEGNPPQTFLNEELIRVLKVTPEFLEAEKKKQLGVMTEQQQKFRPGRAKPSVAGKSVILIDDGVATGSTVRAALKALRGEKPAHLTLATPVAPPSTVSELAKEVDEVVCLLSPENFQAVGQFYRHFPRLEDDKVVELLKG